jgi:hypothetical protein
LSSCLLSKNIKITILKNHNFACETSSLALKVELRLSIFDSGVVSRTYGTKGDEVTGG